MFVWSPVSFFGVLFSLFVSSSFVGCSFFFLVCAVFLGVFPSVLPILLGLLWRLRSAGYFGGRVGFACHCVSV